MVESQLSRFGNPPHESASARFGITRTTLTIPRTMSHYCGDTTRFATRSSKPAPIQRFWWRKAMAAPTRSRATTRSAPSPCATAIEAGPGRRGYLSSKGRSSGAARPSLFQGLRGPTPPTASASGPTKQPTSACGAPLMNENDGGAGRFPGASRRAIVLRLTSLRWPATLISSLARAA
jgi:hypothetical protein